MWQRCTKSDESCNEENSMSSVSQLHARCEFHTDFSRPPFFPSRPFRPPTAPSRRTVNACNLSCQICLYETRPLALKRAALDFRGA